MPGLDEKEPRMKGKEKERERERVADEREKKRGKGRMGASRACTRGARGRWGHHAPKLLDSVIGYLRCD